MMEKKLTPLLNSEEIATIVSRLAKEIREGFLDKENPLVVGVLSGSFIFMADLVRALNFTLEVDFIRAASYCKGSTPTLEVKLNNTLKIDIKGKDVLLVEDIVDTGNTLSSLSSLILNAGANSITTCTLLKRKNSPVTIDYIGYIVEDGFVVGYGLDYKEKFRHLPALYFC